MSEGEIGECVFARHNYTFTVAKAAAAASATNSRQASLQAVVNKMLFRSFTLLSFLSFLSARTHLYIRLGGRRRISSHLERGRQERRKANTAAAAADAALYCQHYDSVIWSDHV